MESDPYTVLAEAHKLSRDVAKGRLIRSLYSLVDDDVLSCFPTLRKWIRVSSNKIDELGYSSSVLGRRFYLNGDNKLSVFNAQIQGSVAHSMQAVLCKLHPAYTPYLFTEIHDSLVMTAPTKFVPDLINSVVPLMLRPLEGLMDNPPKMVVRVSIGDAWKKWREYKVFGQRVNKTGTKHEA
jgi:DNA polymerase I-like protein with 3'-5' exonuclease and polymerase domains